jgi:uncharacterized membrane protein
MEGDGPKEAGTSRSEFLSWMAGFLILTFVIPGLIILLLPSEQRAHAIAVLASVPFIEYLAIGVGIGLGLDPWTSLVLTVSPCIGIVMLVMGALDYLSGRSERATRFRARVRAKIEKYPRPRRYGVVSNTLLVIITGMYLAPGIALLVGWPKTMSLLFMALGVVLITAVIGLATVGVIEVFFA